MSVTKKPSDFSLGLCVRNYLRRLAVRSGIVYHGSVSCFQSDLMYEGKVIVNLIRSQRS